MYMYIYRVDLAFSEGGAKPSGESLKQGIWVAVPPEAIGCLVLKYQNLRFRAPEFLKRSI